MRKLEIYEGDPFFPAAVALEVTRRCNFNCLHCGSEADNRRREDELTLEEWKDVVDQLAEMGTVHFTLSGGEPFLWPHWRELCRHIRSKDGVLSVVSNGSRITEKDARFLKEMQFNNVGLSLDGMEETHNRIRRNPLSFERVERSIRHLKNAGVVVSVITSVNKLNFAELGRLETYLQEIGVDTWQIQIVNAFGRAGQLREMLLIDPGQYLGVVHFMAEAQRRAATSGSGFRIFPADSIGYCEGAAKEIFGDLDWTGCNAGRYVVGIQANGDVVGCLSLQSEGIPPAGNVRRRNLAAIWNDDAAFAYNRDFTVDRLKGSCGGCPHGEECRGGCLGMGYSVSGELHNNPFCYHRIAAGGTRA